MRRFLSLVCFAVVLGVPFAACAQYGVTFGPGSDAHLDRVQSASLSPTSTMAATAPVQHPTAKELPQKAPDTKDQLDRIQTLIDNLRAVALEAPPQAAPAPQVIALPPTQVTIPAEIRDVIVSIGVALITTGIGLGLTWMRQHFAFMQEVGANARITDAAKGVGAMLEKELLSQGRTLATVDVNNPTVAHFAQMLINSYPEWGPLVGLTLDVAKRKVMGAGLQQSVQPLLPPPPAVVLPVTA